MHRGQVLVSRFVMKFRREGAVRACFSIARAAATVPPRFGTHLREWWFDRKKGVSTSGVVPRTLLGLSPEESQRATCHVPTPVEELREILSSLDLDYRDYCFVDLGSGKGRALFVAAEFPFPKILGIEISSVLHEIAQKNVGELSDARITVECR